MVLIRHRIVLFQFAIANFPEVKTQLIVNYPSQYQGHYGPILMSFTLLLLRLILDLCQKFGKQSGTLQHQSVVKCNVDYMEIVQMIYRLLLVFVLIFALAPVSTAALSGDTKAYQSPPKDSVKGFCPTPSTC